MFPDEEYSFASGRTDNEAVLKCSSPGLDTDSMSGRETPEGITLSDIQLVKCVRWDVPNANAAAGDTSIRRRAVPREIPPDQATISLKKSISSGKQQHSRRPSFEIGSAVDRGATPNSDYESEDKNKWLASPRFSPISTDSYTPEKPNIDSITAISDLYHQSCVASEDASSLDHEHMMNSSRFDGRSSYRSSGDEYSSKALHHQGRHKISHITEAVRRSSARSSSDNTALKILGSRGLHSRNGTYDEFGKGERGFTLSPLPSHSQIRAAQRSYNSDSETVDSGSLGESGYSDMIPGGGYRHGEVDYWSLEAAANPYSRCPELQPRFQWLKRSVAPFTALAGAFLVSLASM